MSASRSEVGSKGLLDFSKNNCKKSTQATAVICWQLLGLLHRAVGTITARSENAKKTFVGTVY